MKWDVKHDRAKKVLNHFLDNAGYWTEVENLTDGLTEEEIQEVNAEVATMIQSITKRYKLDVMLPAEPVVEEKSQEEVKTEEQAVEAPAEEEPGNVRSSGRGCVPLSSSCGLYPGGGKADPLVEAMQG